VTLISARTLSTIYEPTRIVCDAPGCKKQWVKPPDISARRKKGWDYRGHMDLCPKHAKDRRKCPMCGQATNEPSAVQALDGEGT
jgi:hypothetical protein